LGSAIILTSAGKARELGVPIWDEAELLKNLPGA
jgi:hypothetical protein